MNADLYYWRPAERQERFWIRDGRKWTEPNAELGEPYFPEDHMSVTQPCGCQVVGTALVQPCPVHARLLVEVS